MGASVKLITTHLIICRGKVNRRNIPLPGVASVEIGRHGFNQ